MEVFVSVLWQRVLRRKSLSNEISEGCLWIESRTIFAILIIDQPTYLTVAMRIKVVV